MLHNFIQLLCYTLLSVAHALSLWICVMKTFYFSWIYASVLTFCTWAWISIMTKELFSGTHLKLECFQLKNCFSLALNGGQVNQYCCGCLTTQMVAFDLSSTWREMEMYGEHFDISRSKLLQAQLISCAF